MKKLLISAILLLGSFSMASAELGVKIGISGNMGVFEATGSESENGTVTRNVPGDKAEMLGAMGSVFGEVRLGFLPGPLSRISVGYDHVIHKIQTGTAGRTDINGDLRGKANGNDVRFQSTNSVSATIDNINTMYALVNITDWLFIRAGVIEADITTEETLDSGSDYGNTSVDGTVFGAGVAFQTESGFFMRAEVNETELDGVILTSTTNSDNSVKLDGIDGKTARISVGKSF